MGVIAPNTKELSMPPQKTQSPLAALLGPRFRQFYEKHRHDEIEYSQFGGLPGGINGGIARVFSVKFDKVGEGKKNAGAPYFMAQATVLSPKEFNGEYIEGRQTRVMKVIAGDDDETYGKAVKWVTNLLQMIGVETPKTDYDALEPYLAAIEQIGPTIKFRTWKPDPQEIKQIGDKWFCVTMKNGRVGRTLGGPYRTEVDAKAAHPYAGEEPRVQEMWDGTVVWRGDTEPYAATNDHSPAAVNGQQQTTRQTPPTDFDEFGDLDSLARRATEGDDDAIAALTTQAKNAGVSDASISAADNWDDVVALITAAGGESSAGQEGEPEEQAEGEDEEPEWKPEVGEVYLYKPKDPATGKVLKDPKSKKERVVDIEIVSVNEETNTVTAKDSNTKKVFLDTKKKPLQISWDELLDESQAAS